MILVEGVFIQKTSDNDGREYLPKTTWENIIDKPLNLVTLDTEQRFTANKTFSAGLIVSDIEGETRYLGSRIDYTNDMDGQEYSIYFPRKNGTLLVSENPDDFATLSTAQNITGKKTFTGYAYMKGVANSTDTAPQFYGLRIKGSDAFGAQLNFGDSNYIYFYEYEDDRLRLHTKKFDFDGLSEGLSINGIVGTEGQVLTSHGTSKAPTWETPSASGNFVTLDTDQNITGHKNFDMEIGVTDGEEIATGYGLGSITHSNDGGRTRYTYTLPKKNGEFALTTDIKTYTSGTGVSISSSNVISTTAASSTASGHVSTTTQTFAGRKTFNGGINIPSGATIQLGGSSGTEGQVLTSHGTSQAPTWETPKGGNDTHYTAYLYLASTSTASSQTSGSITNPYMNLVDGGSRQTSIHLVAGTGMTVTASGTSATSRTITIDGFSGNYSDLTGAPNSLKNPSALTLYIGGVSTLYDGSRAVSATIIKPLDAWPIGSVYISYTSTSPASIFGGSWTSITGRFPYFNAGTGTGGSNTHTLTVSELPAHMHGLYATDQSFGESTYMQARSILFDVYGHANGEAIWSAGTKTKTAIMENSTTSIGGGSSFSIMPAYQSFYAWRRTA